MKIIYFLLFMSFIWHYSQNASSEWYNADNKLSQYNITDIIQDKYGFIWLATEKGIVRYDGASFLLKPQQKLSNFSFGNFYGNVGQDSIVNFNFLQKEALLISNATTKQINIPQKNSKVQVKNGKIYQHFVKNNLPPSFFTGINSYFIKTKNSIYSFDNNKIIYKTYKREIVLPIEFAYPDLSHIFMFGSSIFFADVKKKKLFVIKDGVISQRKAPDILLNPSSKIFWHQTTGQSFVIHKNNIYLINYNKDILSLQFLVHYDDLEKNSFNSIYLQSNSKKIFLGSINKGLNIISIPLFNVSQKKLPFSDEIYYAALPFNDNSIITEEGWIYSKNEAKKVFDNHKIPDKFYLLYDKNKNLTYKGYYNISKRYKKDNYKIKRDVAVFKDVIQGIFESKGLYFTSFNKNNKYYLSVFDDDNFQSLRCKINIPGYVFSVYRYNKDLFYIATSNGLYKASIFHKKIIQTVTKELAVKHIISTKDGNLWLTTFNHGIYHLKNNILKKLPLDPNENLKTAHYILEDNDGYLWISSNNGLFRSKKSDFSDYVQGRKKKITYFRYGKESGFLNNEFNGSSNPCATKLKNGYFVFPSMDGFVFFDPKKVNTYFPTKKDFHINEIIADGKELKFKNEIVLKSSYKKASAVIDLPYYSDIDNIYLESKIAGKDTDWKKIKEDKIINLDNLTPGDYTLSIRYLIEEGIFTNKEFKIKIIPQIYETLWFKISVIIILSLLLFLIVQWRSNFFRNKNKLLENVLAERKEELELEKIKVKKSEDKLKEESVYQQKLVQTITHDISSPLRFIAMMTNKLSNTSDETLQKRYFDSIYKSSEELYKFTQELKNYTYLFRTENIENDNYYSLTSVFESKARLFTELAREKKVTILNFSCDNLIIKINKDILSSIIHNLLDNAIKNTSDGFISINTKAINNNTIKIIIRDTGTGMSNEQITYYTELFESKDEEDLVFKKYGLGLHLIIKLVKKINAKIFFSKNIPKGTSIELHLKIICNEKNINC